jgi:SAM-dependent methyltransferase
MDGEVVPPLAFDRGAATARLHLEEIVACPRCRSRLNASASKWACANPACEFAHKGYPTAGGQPVLMDFEQSVFRREDYDEIDKVLPSSDGVKFSGSFRTYTNRTFRDRIRIAVYGINRIAPKNSLTVLQSLKGKAEHPRLLIIGGGTIGEGTDRFYEDGAVDIVAIDVYPSPFTCLLADAHWLPFADGVFDGVWIQSVLEHVLEPHRVVEQIYRVLKPDGLVYAETPFMMQVHEGAHDFTRFTLSGHRWLFRNFDQIEGGSLGGAGWAMLWSVRYFWRALGIGDKAATALTAPFFWLRYFDRLMRRRTSADAGLGFFFFGRKSHTAMGPKEIIAYYQTQ